MRVVALIETLFHLGSAWFLYGRTVDMTRMPVSPVPGWSAWALAVVLGASVVLAVVAAGVSGWRIRRRGVAAAPVLRALLYAVVAWWMYHMLGDAPLRPIVLKNTAALGLGALASLRALSPLLGRPPLSRIRRAGDLLLGNAILFLVLGELGLRVLSRVHPTPLYDRSAYSPMQRLVAHRLAPGFQHYGFPANSRGYNDTEFEEVPADDVVIASVGDSFSLCAVPHPFHYTTVCEESLDGVSVLNFGAPGVGPEEYLYLIQNEILAFQPDAIVVSLFLGNDLRDLRVDHRSPKGLRAWFHTDRWLSVLVVRRLLLLQGDRERWVQSVESGAGEPLRTRQQFLDAYPFLADPLLEEPQMTREVFVLLEARRARRICAEDPADVERLQEVFDQMLEAAGEIPLLFMIIPDESQVEDALWNDVVATMPTLAGQPRHRPQQRLAEYFDRRGVPYLDLLPTLLEVPALEDGDRHCYALQDTHFNARGCRVAGEALARFLVREGVVE